MVDLSTFIDDPRRHIRRFHSIQGKACRLVIDFFASDYPEHCEVAHVRLSMANFHDWLDERMRDSSKSTFTTPEIAEIIGRTVNKTIAYVNRGLVKPSVQQSKGHGSRRLWSRLDVVRLVAIRHLEDLGLTVPMLRLICGEMTDARMREFSNWVIYTTDDTGPIIPYGLQQTKTTRRNANRLEKRHALVPTHRHTEKGDSARLT